MSVIAFILPAAVAAGLAFLFTPLAGRLARVLGAMDQPGPRKVHNVAVPRFGGIAVLGALVGTAALLRLFEASRMPRLEGESVAIAAGAIPVFVISVLDDIVGVRALPKLMCHLLGASIAVGLGVRLGPTVHAFGEPLEIGWLAIPISLLWLIGVTSAFNLVDGLDGLSSGLALISALSLAAVLIQAGRWEASFLALLIAGALAGFLPWNVHPAKIFLGDTGAAVVGFVLGSLALRSGASLTSGLAVAVPVVILGLPIAETVVSVTRRVLRRSWGRSKSGVSRGVLDSDRDHFHHRLLSLGLEHGKVVWVLWGVGVIAAGMGVAAVFVQGERTGLLLVALFAASGLGLSRLRYDEFAVFRRGSVLRLYEAPVLRTTVFVVFVDLVLVAIASWGAIGLKWGDWGLFRHRADAMALAGVMAPSMVAALSALGLYAGLWRLSSIGEVGRLAAAVAASVFAGLLLDRFVLGGALPLSVFAIFGLLKGFLSIGTRTSYRLLEYVFQRAATSGAPVAIWGADIDGMATQRTLWEHPELKMRPVALLDERAALRGARLNGLKVEGSIEALPRLAIRFPKLIVVVPAQSVLSDSLRDGIAACRDSGVQLVQMELRFRAVVPEGPDAMTPEIAASAGSGSA